MAGFVSFQFLRPANIDDPYIVMTTWESEAHYRLWAQSDAFKEGHALSGSLPSETFLGRPMLETFEVIGDPAN